MSGLVANRFCSTKHTVILALHPMQRSGPFIKLVDLVAVLQHEFLDFMPFPLWLVRSPKILVFGTLPQNLKLFGRICLHTRETSGGRPWFLCPWALRPLAMEESTCPSSCPIKSRRRHVRIGHLEDADSAMKTRHRGVSQNVLQLSKVQTTVCKICDTIQSNMMGLKQISSNLIGFIWI